MRPELDIRNGTRVSGLAARAAATFRSGGWRVADTGNYGGAVVAVTTVYYPAGDQQAAQQLSAQFRKIARVVQQKSLAAGGPLTVVLGTDWAN